MKAIIIGAGRGSRLETLTDEIPKTLVPVMGRPMLEAILEALRFAGFEDKDIVFVCGYQKEVVKERYPGLTYVDNDDWERNNILLSLFKARAWMSEGFVSTYADIVYTPAVARAITLASADVAIGCDTDWKRRYEGRTQHPDTDAEKLIAEGRRVVRFSRKIPRDEATGEFIGVMKVGPTRAGAIVRRFEALEARYAGQTFREGRVFDKAYLLDFLDFLVDDGELIERIDTHGGYMEIDTLQDRAFAEAWWSGGHGSGPAAK